MITIYKFPLEEVTNEFVLPIFAVVRHVGQQNGIPTLWIEVNTEEKEKCKRKFNYYGTGWELPYSGLVYLGSTQTPAGLVWHVCEDVR